MSRVIQSLLRLLCALAFTFTVIANGQGLTSLESQSGESDGTPTDALVNESGNFFIIELATPPTSEGSTQASTDQDKQNFRDQAKAKGVRYQERKSYSDLFNGLAITAPKSEVSRLKKLSSVRAIYPDVAVRMPERGSNPAPELSTALAQTGADIAQSQGYTGRGIKIAIVDTGTDYNHPDLGGCFGPGCKVAGGYDLVGDAFNADPSSIGYNPVTVPDNDPDDCAGHGTHVSGIAAAKAAAAGGVTGVAPDATIYAYRVFGCEGSTLSSVMLEAMERAAKDRVDVLNMSIGAAFQTWPGYPTAIGADRLVKRGVVVVASIGNSGASGVYSAGAPGVGKTVIGVASFNNTFAKLAAFSISPDNKLNGFNPAAAAPRPPATGDFPLARTGTQTTANDGCNSLAAGSLIGKVALIRRGTCGFAVKAANAQAAGAAGVVLYNNSGGTALITPTVAGPVQITIPVVFVSQNDGQTIDTRLAAGTVTMQWTNSVISLPNPGAGLISSFSSFGLAADLSMKPDIGAPGGAIRSTLPLELGGYGSLDGTSMASPHVAGAAALLLQSRRRAGEDDDDHRRVRAGAVRDILQNNAVPAAWWGNPGLGFLDNIQRQGAGMLNIASAIQSKAVVLPGKLSLGEGSAAKTVTLTLKRNTGGDHQDENGSPIVYDVTHVAALATGGATNAPAYFSAPATVSIAPASVTLRAGDDKPARVAVTITPNADLSDRSLYGGYIVFTPRGGGNVLRVPFAGFKGDYQSIQVLTPTANNFPWLAKIVGQNLVNQSGGATYTLQNGDLPYVLAHFEHQSQRVRIEVFDANTGAALSRIPDETLLPRNSTATSFFSFTWDGTVVRLDNKGRETDEVITVPNGKYYLKMSVLKALGNENTPADSEVFTTSTITIDRP